MQEFGDPAVAIVGGVAASPVLRRRAQDLVDEFGSQFFNMPKLSFRFAFLPAIGLMFKSYSSHLSIIENQIRYSSKISYAQNTRSAEFRELKPL